MTPGEYPHCREWEVKLHKQSPRPCPGQPPLWRWTVSHFWGGVAVDPLLALEVWFCCGPVASFIWCPPPPQQAQTLQGGNKLAAWTKIEKLPPPVWCCWEKQVFIKVNNWRFLPECWPFVSWERRGPRLCPGLSHPGNARTTIKLQSKS